MPAQPAPTVKADADQLGRLTSLDRPQPRLAGRLLAVLASGAVAMIVGSCPPDQLS